MFEKLKAFFRRKPPRDLRLLIHTRYRDEAAPERYKRVKLAPELLNRLRQSLCCAPEIREARIYQEIFSHHKSFAEDFVVDENSLAAMAEAKPLDFGDRQPLHSATIL